MVYADYEYYQKAYHGTMSENDFARMAVRASSYLDYITRGKAANNADMDAVKMACCSLADQYQVIEGDRERTVSDNQEKASESVGSWSVSYVDRTVTTEQAQERLYAAAFMALSHTGLLYRGGRCCKCDYLTL